jgi:hypothetical protein
MKCIACQTHFCWLCGEIVEDAMTPAHYDVRLLRARSRVSFGLWGN